MSINCDTKQTLAALEARFVPAMDKAFLEDGVDDGELEGLFKIVAEFINSEKYCARTPEQQGERFYGIANHAFTRYLAKDRAASLSLDHPSRLSDFQNGMRAELDEAEYDIRWPLTYPQGFLYPTAKTWLTSAVAGFFVGSTTILLLNRFVFGGGTLLKACSLGGPIGIIIGGGAAIWYISSKMADAASLNVPSATDPKESVETVY